MDAMRENMTLQFLGVHFWNPWVAALTRDLSRAAALPVSVNMYITPPSQLTSLRVHSDFQCSLMVQLSGRKRWRLWKKPKIWLPVRYRHIRGRDQRDDIPVEDLGEPYMDVVR